ncbi:transcriptional repressor [Sporanaerobium hydrogeniformans]|uniref:transcriptional repressor n=1 Tax=Sporanaerobium hydrogeniformans TaxID=3072179 RepID=UPI0027E58A68|nr:transcriptional repressor [Sporanaerobium hydrogeniformans]
MLNKKQEELNWRKGFIYEKLRDKGFRLTKQRQLLIDIILKNECVSCKDIYYKASCIDEQIGIATVYRLVNMLEEIEAIDRKNMYKMSEVGQERPEDAYHIILEDDTVYYLSEAKWKEIIKAGLKVWGYPITQPIKRIESKSS